MEKTYNPVRQWDLFQYEATTSENQFIDYPLWTLYITIGVLIFIACCSFCGILMWFLLIVRGSAQGDLD